MDGRETMPAAGPETLSAEALRDEAAKRFQWIERRLSDIKTDTAVMAEEAKRLEVERVRLDECFELGPRCEPPPGSLTELRRDRAAFR